MRAGAHRGQSVEFPPELELQAVTGSELPDNGS